MADDIVTRLRCNPCDCDGTCYTCQAADEIERLRAEEEIVTNHIMFLIDHSELWDDDGLSIQMPDGWKYHRG